MSGSAQEPAARITTSIISMSKRIAAAFPCMLIPFSQLWKYLSGKSLAEMCEPRRFSPGGVPWKWGVVQGAVWDATFLLKVWRLIAIHWVRQCRRCSPPRPRRVIFRRRGRAGRFPGDCRWFKTPFPPEVRKRLLGKYLFSKSSCLRSELHGFVHELPDYCLGHCVPNITFTVIKGWF